MSRSIRRRIRSKTEGQIRRSNTAPYTEGQIRWLRIRRGFRRQMKSEFLGSFGNGFEIFIKITLSCRPTRPNNANVDVFSTSYYNDDAFSLKQMRIIFYYSSEFLRKSVIF